MILFSGYLTCISPLRYFRTLRRLFAFRFATIQLLISIILVRSYIRLRRRLLRRLLAFLFATIQFATSHIYYSAYILLDIESPLGVCLPSDQW